MQENTMSCNPVMVRGGTPLVTLCRVACAASEELFAAAQREVLERRGEFANRGVSWGYLLGCERAATAQDFPAAWRLWDELGRAVAANVGRASDAEFQPSFCEAYRGPVIREAEGVHFEGLHIDTHPKLDATTDLLRVLINVGDAQRRFRFGDATRVELAEAGLYVDRSSFGADHVERHVTMRDIYIPGRKHGEIYILVFWASIVPHVGVTEESGYFLYSFEAVAPKPLLCPASGFLASEARGSEQPGISSRRLVC